MSGSRRIDGPTPLSEPRRTSTSGGPGRSPAVRARVGRLLDGGAEGVVRANPVPAGGARTGSGRGAARGRRRAADGRGEGDVRAPDEGAADRAPPRPRFHPQSEDACRTSPRAPGVRVHVRVTGKEAPPRE